MNDSLNTLDPNLLISVDIVVEFTSPAVFDLALHHVTNEELTVIRSVLFNLPHSSDDRVLGTLRERLIRGYNVTFDLSRQNDTLAVTVMGIRPPDVTSMNGRFWKAVEKIGTIRGALGI